MKFRLPRVTFWFCQCTFNWKWRVKTSITFAYQRVVTSRCLPGINVVFVIPPMIPKSKLSCRIIILTPPWHCSTCHTNLCFVQQTEQVGHFVHWKSTSSPGSHPTEKRTSRKDLWAAFVLWSVFYFLSFGLIPTRWKENSDKINKMHIQGDVFHFPSSKCLMFENDSLCSSKIMLTNTAKERNSQCDWMQRQTLKKSVNAAHKNMRQGIFPATVFSFHFL